MRKWFCVTVEDFSLRVRTEDGAHLELVRFPGRADARQVD